MLSEKDPPHKTKRPRHPDIFEPPNERQKKDPPPLNMVHPTPAEGVVEALNIDTKNLDRSTLTHVWRAEGGPVSPEHGTTKWVQYKRDMTFWTVTGEIDSRCQTHIKNAEKNL